MFLKYIIQRIHINNHDLHLKTLLSTWYNSKVIFRPNIIRNINTAAEEINVVTAAAENSFYHLQTENHHGHNNIRKMNNYLKYLSPASDSIVMEDTLLSSEQYNYYLTKEYNNVDDIVNSYIKISCHVNKTQEDMSDEKFNNITNSTIEFSNQYSFDHLCNILLHLRLWKSPSSSRAHNFKELWNAIDKTCVSKISEFDTVQRLVLCDHWYQLRLGGISHFNWSVINKISRRTKSLTAEQLTLLLFYINLRRTFPASVDIIDYQVRVSNYAEKMSVEELAICAMGFHKTQKRIRVPELLKEMMNKLKINSKTATSIDIAAIMKVCRTSVTIPLLDQLYHLLGELLPRINDISIICCLHIALAGSNCQFGHVKLLENVVRRMINDLESCRIKDLERMTFLLTMLNIPAELPGMPGENIYEIFANEVSNKLRKPEIIKYPRCLTNLLHYLSIVEIYPLDLIDQALNPQFIGNIYSTVVQKIGFELLCLDTAVGIERPDYQGSRLDEKTKIVLAKTISLPPIKWLNLDKLNGSASNRFLKELMLTTEEIVKNKDNMYVCHILPNYYRPDIVIRLDENNPNRYLKITSDITSGYVGCIRKPIESGIWICFVMGDINITVRNTCEPIGSIQLKLRLLRKLGYKPIWIPWNEFRSPLIDKQQYLANKIKELSEFF